MNSESGLTHLFDIALTTPTLPTPLVHRPHLLETLVHTFTTRTDTICVEASEGWGKTTLLTDFAANSTYVIFSLFLPTSSRLAYDPVFVRHDLANQISWFLYAQRLRDAEDPTEGDLRLLWTKCARWLERKRQVAYVVVDGLADLPPEDRHIKEALLEYLPLRIKNFRFIFSGDPEALFSESHRGLGVKSYPIPPFTPHESDQYLKDVIPSAEVRADIHLLFRGVPAALASVRRQVQAGENPEQILETPHSNVDDLLKLEWSKIATQPNAVRQALAFIVAYAHPVSTESLSSHCGVPSTELASHLGKVPFLVFNEKSAGWQFASDTFRRFAERNLKSDVSGAIETIADTLLNSPDSSDSISRLPTYLERAGKTDALIEWLQEGRLVRLLLKTRTTWEVDQILRTAIRICHNGTRDRPLVNYALARSIIRQASETSGLEHEVKARITLGDMDGALRIANDAPLITQRMRLLGNAAQAMQDINGVSDTVLVEQIRQLFESVDPATLSSEEVLDIATDIFPVDPGLALDLIKSLSSSDGDTSSFDLALTKITVSALTKATPENTERTTNPAPVEHVVDLKLRRFLDVTEAFFRPKSADQLLDAVKKLDDGSQIMFFLGKWAARNPQREDAIEVVDYALHRAIADQNFVINASFYREISVPLPYAKKLERRRTLISILDGQRAVIRAKGPTQDVVRLELRIAECEYQEDPARATDRLEDLFLEIVDPIKELDKKVSCLAWFASKIEPLRGASDPAELHAIRDLINREFQTHLNELLSTSAEQFLVLKDPIGALAITMPEQATEVALRLNVVERRQAALLEVIRGMCRARTTKPNPHVMLSTLSRFEDGYELDRAVREVTRRLAADVTAGVDTSNNLAALLQQIERVWSAAQRTRCYADLAVSVHASSDEALGTKVNERFERAFNEIESPRAKFKSACELIPLLKQACPNMARFVFSYLQDPLRESFGSEAIDRGITLSLHLLVKAFYLLTSSKSATEDDLRRLLEVISNTREPHDKAHVLSSLAIYLHRASHDRWFSDVVNQTLWPLILNLRHSDLRVSYHAWALAYPAFWLDDRDRARKAIERFPRAVRESCVGRLCDVLISKQPPGEPFSGSSKIALELSYREIQNLLQLCHETDRDYEIYSIFENIGNSLSDRDAVRKLTRDQKAEVARQMLEVAETCLPSKVRIQHVGFRLICKAQAYRISIPRGSSWDALIDEANKLENVADKTYVLTIMADCLSSSARRKAEGVFRKASECADEIPAEEDKIHRLSLIAECARSVDRAFAEETIRKAISVLGLASSGISVRHERKLIDTAYRVDPELPMKLASIYDDDPARESYQSRVSGQVSDLELRRDLSDARSGLSLESLKDDPRVALASWEALGGLNAGRMMAAKIDRIRDMLTCCSNYPLTTSFPMYSWVLSNAGVKYSKTRQGQTLLRDLFDGVLGGVSFFVAVAREHGRLGVNPQWKEVDDNSPHAMIGIGEEEKAIEFIRAWLRESLSSWIVFFDPYFGLPELRFILFVLEADPSVRVRVVTSRAHQRQQGLGEHVAAAYSAYWTKLCEQRPPDTEVVVVGVEDSGEAPFHDRWILTEGGGLRVGCSLNGLGKKLSAISRLEGGEFAAIDSQVRSYTNRDVREYKGQRVRYELFEL